jgi:hypothetical protein
VNGPNTLYLIIFLIFALKLVIVFFVHFVASYLYVRFSTGLGATAKTGTPVKFGKFYAICGQTAPMGSAMKTAAKLAWLLMLVSFTIISTAIGLAFVFVPEHVEVSMYGGLPIVTDTANAPLLMHFLNSAVNGLIYACIGTAIAAAMIQFFRKLVVPDATLETTGAG